MKEDPLGGVKCFTIGGRMVEQRQRCLGMTDEERRWRAQWLKDQILSPDEPRNVPEYYKDTTNFLRRMYKTPLYWLQKSLVPSVGPDNAFIIRHTIGKFMMIFGAIYIGTYYIKYHSNDFTINRTLITNMRRPMYPDDPDYPNYLVKEPYQYYDQGFYSSVLCQDVKPSPPYSPPASPSEEIVESQICPGKEQ